MGYSGCIDCARTCNHNRYFVKATVLKIQNRSSQRIVVDILGIKFKSSRNRFVDGIVFFDHDLPLAYTKSGGKSNGSGSVRQNISSRVYITSS